MNFIKKIFLSTVLIFSFVGCSSISADNASEFGVETRNPKWAQPIQAEGLDNLFKVSDDVYRSAQPTEGGMTSAKNLGIKTVISLRDTELDKDLNASENAGLNTIHIPITTWHVTDDEILKALVILRDGPKPVLVHCRHGADRTGLIIALYRIVYQGWAKEEAKDEMLHGGYGYHSIWTNIPREIDHADIDTLRQALLGVDKK